MIKAVSLWVGSLLIPAQPIPSNDSVRIEIAHHIRKMIDAKDRHTSSALPLEYLQANPLNFCRLLINDCYHELFLELKSCGITLEQIQVLQKIHQQKIREEDHQRRLNPSEKSANATVKKIVNELAIRWNITDPLRVINYRGNSCMGCARITEVFFDEEWWENELDKNLDVLRSIAGHELSHILMQDVALYEALDELQKKIKNKRVAQRAEKSINRLCKLTEVQADIESSLESKSALKGYACWTAHDIACCGDNGGESHPLMSDRSYLAGLLKQLNDRYEPQSRKKRKIE